MSGGSYDYLCWAMDLGELAAKEHQLEAMADRLAGLGYAQDAARETQELLVQLRQFKVRAEVRRERLADVWHAVEWWDSHDKTEHSVREALAKYRGEPTPAKPCSDTPPLGLLGQPVGPCILIGEHTTHQDPTGCRWTPRPDGPKEEQS